MTLVNYTFGTCATAATNADQWVMWTNSTTVAQTIDAWQNWITTYNSKGKWIGQQPHEQERARELQERIARADRELKERDQRAQGLLMSYLNPIQRADLEKNGWFLVDGKSGARYRIRKGSLTGNVDVLNEDGSVRHRLCAHDRMIGTPLHDQLLAQKFHLEHYEAEFLRIANRS